MEVATSSALPAENTPEAELNRLKSQLENGASWFFWVAGLSLINSIILLTGSDTSFIIGLGVTQVIDSIAVNLADTIGLLAKGIAFAADTLAAAVFVGVGVLARKRYLAVYLAGMILYALDGAIFLIAQDYVSVAFHGFVLCCLWSGFLAARRFNATTLTIQALGG